MADGSNYRYRRGTDFSRPEAGQGDPLAELARLIGQNDPYSDFARSEQQRPSSYGQPVAPEWSSPQHQPAPHDPHARPEWDQPRYADQSDYGDPARYDEHLRYNEPAPYAQPDPYAPPATHADSRYGAYDDRHADPYRGQSGGYSDSASYRDSAYPDDRGYQDHAGYQQAGGYADYPAQGGYDDRYGAPGQQAAHGYADDPYYGTMPRDEDIYERRRPPKRGGLVTVIAVLALAVLGTAGAFAYRTVFSKSGAPLSPPVIKADPGPNKVMPAGGEQQAGKAIQDRVGERPQSERVVSREEQPVDIRNAPMRTILPGAPNPVTGLPSGANAANMPPAGMASSFPPQAGQSGSAFNASTGSGSPAPLQSTVPPSTEPKRIKTVPIRPDQADAAPQARAPAPAPRAPAADNAGPLSLSPAASRSAASANPPAPARTAAIAPATTESFSEGAYSVQVTSQRSEADARASWQSLQGKYSSVLGGRQAAIRRADLGARGVYYRAMVGPFSSSGDATEFCNSLKSAGGDCVIQKN